MLKNKTIRIRIPDYDAINSVIEGGLGVASIRIVLRKTATALKPRYKVLVQAAKSIYSSGHGHRSGALAAAFGHKAWSAKRGTPRAAVIVGVNNKSKVSQNKFRAWQQRARNLYQKTLEGRMTHPIPKRLSDPSYHKPSKILHLVDNPVKSHQVKPRHRKKLAAPEKGENAIWPVSRQSGGTPGRNVVARIRRTGARIAKRYHAQEFHRILEAEVGKKLARATRKTVPGRSRGRALAS